MARDRLEVLEGLDEAAKALEGRFPPIEELISSEDEFNTANLTPLCIVENYLWEDVGILFAPGGTGKTTLILYEAICIALGKPLWGLTIESPGKTLVITAEDPREILLARIRLICQSMYLSNEEISLVRESVIILDVSSKFVKLIEDSHIKGIMLSADTKLICTAYEDANIRMVIIDPAISFGVSESKVNDNEQGLIMAGRMIVKRLRACVRYIHHTGKSSADNKTKQSQYSGRGGSAFADGCRMVAGISEGSRRDLPTQTQVGNTSSIIKLLRHKLTYAPRQPGIIIVRDGYSFTHSIDAPKTADQTIKSEKLQLLNWIYQAERSRNLYLNKTSIESGYLSELGMARADFRTAITQLEAEGDVIHVPVPENLRQGNRKDYLHAIRDSSMPNQINSAD